MIKKEVFLVSELGLHARPCGRIATGLSALNLSLAEIYYEDKKANLKSIMELLTICVKMKTTALVKLDGPDEQKALKIIEEVFSTEEKGKKI